MTKSDLPRQPRTSSWTQVRAYQDQTCRRPFQCSASRCPCCRFRPRAGCPFQLHAVRSRWIHLVIDRLIRKVPVTLARWKCPVCRRTFTDYPSFMLARKRFALPELRALAKHYLTDESTTYRRAVTDNGLPLFHETRAVVHTEQADREECTSVLSHTTLYRWVTTLGSSAPEGDTTGVSRRKCRTAARRKIVIACLRTC